MTDYVTTRNVLAECHQIAISREDFLNIQKAYSNLENIISSEEQFDAVARNFFDLEADLLATTLEFTYVGFGDTKKAMAARRLLNRRLLNFLSAARGYMDHQRHAVKEIFGPADPRADEAVEMFRIAHSENFGYRLMEELRNACQHRIFPIQSVVFKMQNERAVNALHNRVEIHVDVAELKADKKFKQKVLDELSAYGERVDLRPFIRTYIQGIAQAHAYFRDKAIEIANQSKDVLQREIDRYKSEGQQNEILGLHAAQLDGGIRTNCVPLAPDFWAYGEYLTKQNMHFCSASVTYVSSSILNNRD